MDQLFTRSRVSFFMNRFRKLGFIDYNGGLQVQQLSAARCAARLNPLRQPVLSTSPAQTEQS